MLKRVLWKLCECAKAHFITSAISLGGSEQNKCNFLLLPFSRITKKNKIGSNEKNLMHSVLDAISLVKLLLKAKVRNVITESRSRNGSIACEKVAHMSL